MPNLINKKDAAHLKSFEKQAREIVNRIAADRDKLRALISEYEEILETTEEGLRDFDSALDTMSQYL